MQRTKRKGQCLILSMLLLFVAAFTIMEKAEGKSLSVTAKVASKDVTNKTLAMTKGTEKQIALNIHPKAAKTTVTYKSSKKSVVAVSPSGKLTAKKKGTAQITVTVKDSNKNKEKIWIMVKVTGKKDSASDTDSTIAIKLRIKGKEFPAKLYDNKTSRELVERMPFTITMEELNGNEKYYYFDKSFSTNSKKPSEIQTGDLMLYGSDCLVLFYKSFSTSYSYTSLGYVENVQGLADALGRGNVKVSFEKGE